MKKINGTLSVLALFYLTGQSAFAFMPPSYRAAMTSEEATADGISLSNPESLGEITPQLMGELGTVTLRSGDRSVEWEANVHSRGAVQLWGEPVFTISNDYSLEQMDQILKRFIDENYEVLKVHASDLRVNRVRSRFSGPFRYISYDRVVVTEDQPYFVDGAYLTFRFKMNRLIEITNHSFGEIGEVQAPMISDQDAINTVMEDAKFDESSDRITRQVRAKVKPFFTPDHQVQFQYVYQVKVRKGRRDAWLYQVSASDGRVVALTSGLSTEGQVVGEVYPRNIVGGELARVPFAELNMRNGSDKERTDAEGKFSMDASGAIADLAGARAIVETDANKISKPVPASGTVMFSAADHLSETMAYYHIGRVNAFVRQFIKAAPFAVRTSSGSHGVDFLNTPIVVNTHVQEASITSCNAWFDPDALTLNFISEDSKCRDSAQFADILYHEWGHALDNALGDGIQDSAFSEGIGDFNSYLIVSDPKLGVGFIKSRPDAPIRDISAAVKVYPKDRSRDPHAESLIISGAWFEVAERFKQIYGAEEGRAKIAELWYKHLVSTHHYLDSYMGALVVDSDDGDLSKCTPHMCIFNTAFSRRGLTKLDPRCGGKVTAAARQLPACKDGTLPADAGME